MKFFLRILIRISLILNYLPCCTVIWSINSSPTGCDHRQRERTRSLLGMRHQMSSPSQIIEHWIHCIFPWGKLIVRTKVGCKIWDVDVQADRNRSHETEMLTCSCFKTYSSDLQASALGLAISAYFDLRDDESRRVILCESFFYEFDMLSIRSYLFQGAQMLDFGQAWSYKISAAVWVQSSSQHHRHGLPNSRPLACHTTTGIMNNCVVFVFSSSPA